MHKQETRDEGNGKSCQFPSQFIDAAEKRPHTVDAGSRPGFHLRTVPDDKLQPLLAEHRDVKPKPAKFRKALYSKIHCLAAVANFSRSGSLRASEYTRTT